MIPKIVHHQAPRDFARWHPIWFGCVKSWHRQFWDHDYRLWDDETMNDFVKREYPQYYKTFCSFPFPILKIDFCRPLLLHKYGGIYSDLDYVVLHNFRQYLDHTKINIVESTVSFLPSWQETIQNSMMASPPNCKFWLDFCDYSTEMFARKDVKEELEYSFENKKLMVEGWAVKATTGPIALTNFWKETNADINVLPRELFTPRIKDAVVESDRIELTVCEDHPQDKCDKENLQGAHLQTGNW